jgi:hypothetical protein
VAYTDQLKVADDGVFQYKVMAASILVARDVLNEAGTVTGHAKRADLAYRVLQEPEAYRRRFAFAIVTNASISLASTDAALKTEVAAVWGHVAGVTAPESP